MAKRLLNGIVCLTLLLASHCALSMERALFYRLIFENKEEVWLFASSHSAYQKDDVVAKILQDLLRRSSRIAIENVIGLDSPAKVSFLNLKYSGIKRTDLSSSSQACMRLFETLRNSMPNVVYDLPPPAFALYAQAKLLAPTSRIPRPSSKYGWDGVIFSHAITIHHGIEEIEGASGQLAFFNSLTRDNVETMMSGLCRLAKDEFSLERRDLLIKLQQEMYLKQDVEQVRILEQQIVEAAGWDDSIVSRFFDIRNEYMARRIIELAKLKKVDFFAIGAAHLGGRSSVLTNLQSAGVKVIPVPVDSPSLQN